MKPLNILEYSYRKVHHLKVRSARCVYVVGPKEKMPVKIGVCSDVKSRFSNLSCGNWNELFAYDIFWFPGPEVANRLESLAHEFLKNAGKWRIREWFNVTPEWASKTIIFLAHKHYPSIRPLTHAEMIEKLKRQHIDKSDWENDGSAEKMLDAIYGSQQVA